LGVLGVAALSCDGRKGFMGRDELGLPSSKVVELNLSRGVSERGSATLFGPIPDTSYADLLEVLRDIDPEDTKGVFVRLGTANVSLSHAGELGRRLAALKEKGLTITCHADDLDNSTVFFFARACSSVWLTPTGGVDSVGLAFQLMFAKSLLDKLGVGVDFLQVGKYKGAQETYTRDEPSPEARASVEEALANLRAAWLEGVREGRGEGAVSAVEDGPHTAARAKELGLVDHLGYVDEARKSALDAAEAKSPDVVFGGPPGKQKGDGLDELVRALTGAEGMGVPHVAVVRAVGAITMEAGGGLGGGEGITERELGRTLTKLTEDDDVKAVVLRIDSPGGSALASDLLWHKLMKLREKKPLVVSVGGMAASGGYYLSCAGSTIFAEPTSILGSVGVVGGKFSLGGALSSVGVNVVTIPAAPDPIKARRAAYLSPFDRWDDPTRARVEEGMQAIYDTFIQRVAEGRGLSSEEVAKGAEGRIYGGVRAKELKFIDELGGLDDAIQHALQKADLGETGRVKLVGEEPALSALLGGSPDAEARVMEGARRDLDPLASWIDKLPESARVWIDGVTPMTKGETALLLVPFALAPQ
jgi:protease-4